MVGEAKGDKDCACFAIAYAIYNLYGDDPVNNTFDQSYMTQHMIECLKNIFYMPFPSMT
uniref:Ubiquitin-like protease family profile domain-containing protein n=1 Tax=Amphimedon queenslandica TaxID=400682 RepID=A0A1X7UQH1_AMPQE